MNPFAVLGLAPRLQLDAKELERRYLQLSRERHPDLQRGGDLQMAELNAAYRTLRDRWTRARALIEIHDQHLMDATKNLDAGFLTAALELAEAVAEATPATTPALVARLRAAVEAQWERISQALACADHRAAATHLHEARYYQKALADLEAGA